MSHLTVLPVAVPLLAAAILVGAQPVLHRRVLDIASIATAGFVGILCGLFAWRSGSGPIIEWAGAWRPRDGVALGVAFAADRLGSGLACLAAVLATASLVYSWRYFKAVGAIYHALLLVFLAGMAGFCLTGDLFNMFVFFELMGVAAYALTGYKIEEEKSLEGALNFAVVNSLGAFLILIGIALVYARTGALNLAQIGRELSGRPPDGLVVASLVLIVSGLAVKGAIVPFHFWLADAHAVAPSPVCVLFSGAMVELGIFGIARVYWTAFDAAMMRDRWAIGGVFLAVGSVSAVLGGVMCLAQRHLKRLLAFSTISHMGILLVALGLMSPSALAGASIYVVAHGLIKGALFLMAGVLLHCRGTVDEHELRGRGRRLPVVGAAFLLAILGLAGVPPFGTGPGKELIESAGASVGKGWVAIPLVLAAAMTAGAVLRVAGRVFLGLAKLEHQDEEKSRDPDERETPPSTDGRPSWVMMAPVWVLLAGAAFSGAVPSWREPIEAAARRIMDARGYQAAVLDGVPEGSPGATVGRTPGHQAVVSTPIIVVLTLAVAGVALFAERFPPAWRRAATRLRLRMLVPIRTLHSGKVGDYVAWLTLGVSAFGIALFALTGVRWFR